MKLAKLLILSALLFTLMALPAWAAPKKIYVKMAHTGAETTPMHLAQTAIKDYLEKESNGAFEVDIFPGGQLGNENDLIQAVQEGDLEVFATNTGYLVNYNKDLNVFSVPFAFESQEIARKVLDGPFGQKLLGDMEAKTKVRALAYFESLDFRQLTCNKEVRGPADLRGMKIRVMPNPIHIEIWKSLGALPTPIPFAELYTALQQRTVDAQENPVENIVAMKFYEVQDYIIQTRHIITTGMIVCNPAFYNKLSPEHQKIFSDAMNYGSDYWIKTSNEMREDFYKTIEASGTKVVSLSNEEWLSFREAAKPAIDFIAKDVGQDLVDQLFKAIEEASK